MQGNLIQNASQSTTFKFLLLLNYGQPNDTHIMGQSRRCAGLAMLRYLAPEIHLVEKTDRAARGNWGPLRTTSEHAPRVDLPHWLGEGARGQERSCWHRAWDREDRQGARWIAAIVPYDLKWQKWVRQGIMIKRLLGTRLADVSLDESSEWILRLYNYFWSM